MSERLINSYIFDTVELDSDILTPQVTIVAQVGGPARYLGEITEKNGSTKTFSLAVVPAPAEPSANIDVSQTWDESPTYTVAEKGFVVVYVRSGPGGQAIRLFNNTEVLLDNRKLRTGQIVVLRVLRPGQHILRDETGRGECTVTVDYPTRVKKMPAGKVPLQVKNTGGTATEIVPDELTISVLQPLVVTVLDGTHIVTRLQAATDRVEGQLVTQRVEST